MAVQKSTKLKQVFKITSNYKKPAYVTKQYFTVTANILFLGDVRTHLRLLREEIGVLTHSHALPLCSYACSPVSP